jgi:hypothetical protein
MDLGWLTSIAIVLAVLLLLDRLLLRVERKGWMNYRRRGLSRGAAVYHLMELHSIFDPGIQQVIEAEYQQRKEQDESGAPRS